MPNHNQFDVIIIGTGAGGETLAYRLAPSGKRILLLERGDFVPREKDRSRTGGPVASFCGRDRYLFCVDVDGAFHNELATAGQIHRPVRRGTRLPLHHLRGTHFRDEHESGSLLLFGASGWLMGGHMDLPQRAAPGDADCR